MAAFITASRKLRRQIFDCQFSLHFFHEISIRHHDELGPKNVRQMVKSDFYSQLRIWRIGSAHTAVKLRCALRRTSSKLQCDIFQLNATMAQPAYNKEMPLTSNFERQILIGR